MFILLSQLSRILRPFPTLKWPCLMVLDSTSCQGLHSRHVHRTISMRLTSQLHTMRYVKHRTFYQSNTFSSLARHSRAQALKEPREWGLFMRGMASEPEWGSQNKTVLIYITAIGIFMVGAAYAGVPLYRIFCQVSRPWIVLKPYNLVTWIDAH